MIYLDNAATTACASGVVDVMLPFFRDNFANASSIDHAPGNAARRVVEDAREAVATLVGARAEDVIFTSGSTEANNLVSSVNLRLVTTTVEHPSILDAVKARARSDDAFVQVDSNGIVRSHSLAQELASVANPALITIIATNNETGTEQDVEDLVRQAQFGKALLHLDATQSFATRRLLLREMKIDGLSISAHKIHGPKGIGALIAGPRLRKALKPIIHGGGHERGFRSGTLNVPGIAGFGVAAALFSSRTRERREHLAKLRSSFREVLANRLYGGVVDTVDAARSSPHILSLRLVGINGRALLGTVNNAVAFSLGSACATNKAAPSHVLLALGLDKNQISESVRISFSHEQSLSEVVEAANIIAAAAISLGRFSISA